MRVTFGILCLVEGARASTRSVPVRLKQCVKNGRRPRKPSLSEYELMQPINSRVAWLNFYREHNRTAPSGCVLRKGK